MNKQFFAGLGLIISISACSSTPNDHGADLAPHVISIGRDGELESVHGAGVDEENPGIRRQARAEPVFERILDGIAGFKEGAARKIDVLLFIHGGLNDSAQSLQRAADVYQDIKKDGSYPVFINWRSGPVSTYGAHLARIRQGEISGTARLTAPIYFLTDLANSLINAPKSWLVTAEHLFDTAGVRDDDYLNGFSGGDNHVYFTGDQSSFDSLGRSLRFLATSPAKIATTPFVFTLAKPAWDNMLRRTNTPFFTPEDLANRDRDTGTAGKRGEGALYRFLLALKDRIDHEQLSVRVTLVGHSMGAIIVNKIVSLDIGLPIANIVHLASADSINHLLYRVTPYLIDNKDVRFYSLSLHPENEEREVSKGGLLPSGSLLVWIDDMYTTPETVLDRRSGRWTNMERALPLLPTKARERMFFKIYGLNECERSSVGLITEPQQHGDFDQTAFWQEETWWGLGTYGRSRCQP